MYYDSLSVAVHGRLSLRCHRDGHGSQPLSLTQWQEDFAVTHLNRNDPTYVDEYVFN
jgi:hypothetical protein